MSAEFEVVDRPGRFELLLDGLPVAFTDYHDDGDVVALTHTVVDPSRRGRGLGAFLVAEVLAELRRRGKRVQPHCWFVAEFIDLHPEHDDLLAHGGG